jgi:hypothetical protein
MPSAQRLQQPLQRAREPVARCTCTGARVPIHNHKVLNLQTRRVEIRRSEQAVHALSEVGSHLLKIDAQGIQMYLTSLTWMKSSKEFYTYVLVARYSMLGVPAAASSCFAAWRYMLRGMWSYAWRQLSARARGGCRCTTRPMTHYVHAQTQTAQTWTPIIARMPVHRRTTRPRSSLVPTSA